MFDIMIWFKGPIIFEFIPSCPFKHGIILEGIQSQNPKGDEVPTHIFFQ